MIPQQLPPGLTQTKDAKQHLFKFQLDFSELFWSLMNKRVLQNTLSHKKHGNGDMDIKDQTKALCS